MFVFNRAWSALQCDYSNPGDTIGINQKVIIGIYRFIYWFSDTGFLSIALVGVMRKRQIAKQYHDHGAKIYDVNIKGKDKI